MQDVTILKVGLFPLESEAVVATLATPTPVVATEQAPATGPEYPGSVTLIVSPQDNLILNYLPLRSKLSLPCAARVTPKPLHRSGHAAVHYGYKNILRRQRFLTALNPSGLVDLSIFQSYILTQP
jgi:hypothetical protein